LTDSTSVQQATILVEKTQGAILLISGGDDQLWPSSHLSEQVIGRLRQHQHPYPFLHLQYPHAGHSIGLPHLPATVNQIRHPIRRLLLRSGGTARENAHARVDAWARTLEFLGENLAL
jgi:dienelactone hydrolase